MRLHTGVPISRLQAPCRPLELLVPERQEGGKIRVHTSGWDDFKVILPNQVLEAAIIGKQVGLVRVDKPIAYLDIDDTGLVEVGYGPQV
jgi:hypothetical protein